MSWSHYKLLIRVKTERARKYYMQEAAAQNWSVRALERQINSLYYERLLMSRDKKPVVEEMQEKTLPLAATPRDFIKDPYVLEFLGMADTPQFRESKLEQAIMMQALAAKDIKVMRSLIDPDSADDEIFGFHAQQEIMIGYLHEK